MLKTCIVVADRARARLFVLEALPQTSPRLREVQALSNPDGGLTGSQLFSNTRSGSNRAPHGAAFEYDDHREEHRHEHEKRFAKEIATAAVAFIRAHDARKLVLAAEPHLLGLLREILPSRLPDGVVLVELARDFSKQTPARIKDALTRHGAFTKSN